MGAKIQNFAERSQHVGGDAIGETQQRPGGAIAPRYRTAELSSSASPPELKRRPLQPLAIMATIRINLLRRPLWQAETAQEALDINREKLIHLIETGDIAWAFNIGIGHTRRELRILAHCVVERQTSVIRDIGATKNLKLPEVLNLILPQMRETLRGTELQRLLLCNPKHIQLLQLAGEIKRVPERLPAVGPNSSPRFTSKSVREFLEHRRVL